MRYKVGDKVRVRSDLHNCEFYGGYTFEGEMESYRGKIVTITFVGDDYYGIDDCLMYSWTDEMFEPVEEMSAEEAIKTLGDMCARDCKSCELGKLVKESRYSFCTNYRREHPDKVVEVLKQWKKDHEKKDVETEFACIVRVIEDLGNSKRCVYEEDVTEVKDETFKMTMKRILEEYCKENDGKFFTVYEEICRVKE